MTFANQSPLLFLAVLIATTPLNVDADSAEVARSSAEFSSNQMAPLETTALPTLESPEPVSAPSDAKRLRQRRLQLSLLTVIVIIVGLFLFIFLLTLIRTARLYRRRLQLGHRSAPTEYVDVWSQYRLPDDDDQTSAE